MVRGVSASARREILLNTPTGGIAAMQKRKLGNRASALLLLRRPLPRCLLGSRGSFLGTTKPPRLDENLGAAALQLGSDDLSEIEDAAAAIKVPGARYPEELMKLAYERTAHGLRWQVVDGEDSLVALGPGT
jgi:hypothetical protein